LIICTLALTDALYPQPNILSREKGCPGKKDTPFLSGFIRNNTPQKWKNETLKPTILKKGFRKREGKIMFPSAHDITPLTWMAACPTSTTWSDQETN